MPGILLVPLVVFAFVFGKSTSTKAKVVYIDEGGIKQEVSVQEPILVVKDGDTYSVRSGFKPIVSQAYSRRRSGDMGVFDMADAGLRRLQNEPE